MFSMVGWLFWIIFFYTSSPRYLKPSPDYTRRISGRKQFIALSSAKFRTIQRIHSTKSVVLLPRCTGTSASESEGESTEGNVHVRFEFNSHSFCFVLLYPVCNVNAYNTLISSYFMNACVHSLLYDAGSCVYFQMRVHTKQLHTTEHVLFSHFYCLHVFVYTNSCVANHRYDIGIPPSDRMKHYSYHGL